MITPATSTSPPTLFFQSFTAAYVVGGVGIFGGNRCRRLRMAPGALVGGRWVELRGGVGIFCGSTLRIGLDISNRSFLSGGALHIQMRAASTRLDTDILPYTDRQELQIRGHVIRDGRIRQSDAGEAWQTVDVDSEEIRTSSGEVVPIRSGIRLTVYNPRPKDRAPEDVSASAANYNGPALHYGDRIRFVGKLKRPRNFRNPGAFDYEGYLADQGIAALGSAEVSDVESLPGFEGSHLASWRNRIHHSIIAMVHRLWVPREASLIDAMVIGEEAFIDRDTRTDFGALAPITCWWFRG